MPRDRTPYIPLSAFHEYKIEITPLPCDPASPQEYYWHLFYKDRKVNGGISPSTEAARERAGHYRFDHQRQVWLRSHTWDEESFSWEMRDNIVM